MPTKLEESQSTSTTQTTHRLPFAEVNTCGTYVANDNGTLFRVPEDALEAGKSPVIEIVSRRPVMMTKISDDPWVPISKARQLAADRDLYINF